MYTRKYGQRKIDVQFEINKIKYKVHQTISNYDKENKLSKKYLSNFDGKFSLHIFHFATREREKI